MTLAALISRSAELAQLRPLFEKIDPSLELATWPDPRCLQAEVAICWDTPLGTYARMPQLRLIHSIAAGVDNVIDGQDLRGLPICRVVDPSQREGMLQYVLWSVLYFHRRIDEAVASQRRHRWHRPAQLPANSVRVGIMGLGEIGSFVAQSLSGLGYEVHGWARTARELPGVRVFCGDIGYGEFLSRTDVLVCLLPSTPQTRGILGKRSFDALPDGAALVHCGRGSHLVQSDLLSALESGRLRGAVLDVFEQEPLPELSELWSHPDIVVTPHMATVPDFSVAVQQVVDNIRRLESGEALKNCIDPDLGY